MSLPPDFWGWIVGIATNILSYIFGHFVGKKDGG